jgi:phosphoribosylaminoimidazolecarboxamide formyltransferase/IMP cyclohydrolase
MSLRTVRRALLSVSDKTGLVDFARGLAGLGVELISTGGTRKALADAGLPVRDVSDVTGFPEMLDGRVKTLHPRVHGGILAVRDNAEHMAKLREHRIEPIDLVVVNLYPFEATAAKPGVAHEEVVENVDIGGPSLVRAAAKNYHDVAVVTSPDQYAEILTEMQANAGALGLPTREMLAAEAFAHTAAYDAAIAGYFKRRGDADGDPFPERLQLLFQRRQALRYGENPHQRAAFYVESPAPPASLAAAEVLHGKELSYNNLLDLDSALRLVCEFEEPVAVVIKHNNPCGAAEAGTLEEAFRKAQEGDPQSAYGGILGFNRAVDEVTAIQVSEPGRFVECILAPDFEPAALQVLTTRPSWKKNVRLLRVGDLAARAGQPVALDFRSVDGGQLVQDRDEPAGKLPPEVHKADNLSPAPVVTRRAPTDAEKADLRFAWRVCKHVKSNAIVLARGGMVVGVGAGQMSRVDSVQIAVRKAGDRSRGSVLASDAFFPFRDNVDAAAAAGVSAIVQPGGSVRDADSVAACDEHGLAMVFTGVRHFRH